MFDSNRSGSYTIRTIALVVISVSLFGSVQAQERQPGSQNLAWAQEFLWTLYPETKGHRYVLTAKTSQPFDVPIGAIANLGFQIGEMAPGTILGIAAANAITGQNVPKDKKSGPIYAKQFINAFFGFDNIGHLFTFASEGPSVGKQEDYDRVKQLVESHREWTDAENTSALQKAGALYGPKERDKFLHTIPLDQLQKLFGKMDFVSAEFEMTTNDDQRFTLLQWVVIVDVKFTEGGEGTYRMHFEPFKGALTQMDAIPPNK